MGFTNWLTQGTPNTSNEKAYSTTEVPAYLSDYVQNLLGGAYAAASNEYQPYAPPVPDEIKAQGQDAIDAFNASLTEEDYAPYQRIADFDPAQVKSFEDTMTAANAYKPGMENAKAAAEKSGALSTIGTAKPYLDKASATAPSTISDYMNPYQQNVIDKLGSEAQRQVNEKLMPGLSDTFTRAGQYGSTRHQELANRGVRDISDTLQQNIGTALAKGYDTSMTAAQKDLDRQATLAQVSGTLTGTEEANKNALATTMGNLAAKDQSLGITGAAAEEAVGAERRGLEQQRMDMAYNDFVNQRDDPMKKLTFLNEMVRGLPSTGSTNTKNVTTTGASYSPSPIAALAGSATGLSTLSSLLKP
jgi:hypothetical protein